MRARNKIAGKCEIGAEVSTEISAGKVEEMASNEARTETTKPIGERAELSTINESDWFENTAQTKIRAIKEAQGAIKRVTRSQTVDEGSAEEKSTEAQEEREETDLELEELKRLNAGELVEHARKQVEKVRHLTTKEGVLAKKLVFTKADSKEVGLKMDLLLKIVYIMSMGMDMNKSNEEATSRLNTIEKGMDKRMEEMDKKWEERMARLEGLIAGKTNETTDQLPTQPRSKTKEQTKPIEQPKPKEKPMAAKKGQAPLEKNQAKKKDQTRVATTVASSKPGKKAQKAQNKTYANAAAKPGKNWTPPPKEMAKKELVIKITNKTGEEVRKEVKKVLTHEEIQGGFKQVRVLKNGMVVMSCHSEEQRRMVTEKLRTQENAQIRNGSTRNPRIKIRGIMKGTKGEELIADIIAENECIRNVFNEGKLEGQIKTICTYVGAKRDTWVIEVTPEIFKEVMKQGKIMVDMMSHRIAEYDEPMQCYKCCKFGHTAKHCKAAEPTCYVCGGKHEGRTCKVTTKKCINCYKAGSKSGIVHKATDYQCPVYKKQQGEIKKRTNYGQ